MCGQNNGMAKKTWNSQTLGLWMPACLYFRIVQFPVYLPTLNKSDRNQPTGSHQSRLNPMNASRLSVLFQCSGGKAAAKVESLQARLVNSTTPSGDESLQPVLACIWGLLTDFLTDIRMSFCIEIAS